METQTLESAASEVITEILNKQYFFVKVYIEESSMFEMTLEHLENIKTFLERYGNIVAITSGHEVSKKGKHHTHIHYQMRHAPKKKKIPTSPLGQIYKHYTQKTNTIWFTEKYSLALETEPKSIEDLMGYPLKTLEDNPSVFRPLVPVLYGLSPEAVTRLWIRANTIYKQTLARQAQEATKSKVLEDGYAVLEQYIDDHFYDHIPTLETPTHTNLWNLQDIHPTMYKVAYLALKYYKDHKAGKVPYNITRSIHRYALKNNIMSIQDVISTLKLF